MARTTRAIADLDRRLCSLMVDVQAGDRQAYAAVLRACEPLIRRVGRRAGLADDRLDEVLQETLLTLHRARHTFDPSRSFIAWLSVITQRRAIDVMRRHGRWARHEVYAPADYENHPDTSSNADRGFEQSGRVKILSTALESLPVAQREAVERLALREQSLAEASAETGKTTGALKVNFHRALKALRRRLGREDQHV